jgi:hypothetical protein
MNGPLRTAFFTRLLDPVAAQIDKHLRGPRKRSALARGNAVRCASARDLDRQDTDQPTLRKVFRHENGNQVVRTIA